MKVLITGGSGLIGNRLTQLLLAKNIQVVHLTRNRNSKSGVKTYEWDWEKGFIDKKCFEGVSHIIHLAGADIAEKPWTMKRKRFLIKSRIETTGLLSYHIHENDLPIKAFIAASGAGYYGAITNDTIYTENTVPHDDFIAKCSVFCEEAADLFSDKCRVVKFRHGVVLDQNQGVLPKIASSVKTGLGAPLGSGNQFVPWIHIDDIANLFIHAIENEKIKGTYNAVSSEHLTNKELTFSIAETLNKKIRLPRIPRFIIKGIYGELADLTLEGSRVSNQKILDTGFQFQFGSIDEALKEIYSK